MVSVGGLREWVRSGLGFTSVPMSRPSQQRAAPIARTAPPPALGFAVALLLSLAAGFGLPHLPARWHLSVLSPAWMPQQIVRLIEYSNDAQVALLADRRADPHPRIALVLIRDETLANLPYVSPIDRALVARLVRGLDLFGARAVGLDILFDQATEPDKDEELVSVLRSRRAEIVLGGADERTPMSTRRRQWQSQFIGRVDRPFGFFNLRYDVAEARQEHVVRNRAVPAPGSYFARSFAEALALAAGVTSWPAQRRVPWLAPPASGEDTFLNIDADAVLAALADPDGALARALEAQIEGRIVIVGADLDRVDRHPTPLSLTSGAPMLGAAVHAQILAGLLDQRTLADASPPLIGVLAGLAACAGALLGWFIGHRGWWLTAAAGAATLAIVGLSAIVLWQSRAILPLAEIVAVLIAAVILARLLRRRVAR